MSRPTSARSVSPIGSSCSQGIDARNRYCQGISDFMDDHAEMVEARTADLERGLKKTGNRATGLTSLDRRLTFLAPDAASRVGISANCGNGSTTASPCALHPVLMPIGFFCARSTTPSIVLFPS